jgi:hypothetical protein
VEALAEVNAELIGLQTSRRELEYMGDAGERIKSNGRGIVRIGCVWGILVLLVEGQSVRARRLLIQRPRFIPASPLVG